MSSLYALLGGGSYNNQDFKNNTKIKNLLPSFLKNSGYINALNISTPWLLIAFFNIKNGRLKFQEMNFLYFYGAKRTNQTQNEMLSYVEF